MCLTSQSARYDADASVPSVHELLPPPPPHLSGRRSERRTSPLIVDNTICAVPPESISNDGCDDVCPLTTCCSDWMTRKPGSSVVTIPSNTVINCANVVCPNICRMACDRGTCGCNFPVTDRVAFVFLRRRRDPSPAAVMILSLPILRENRSFNCSLVLHCP
jgi:hypothetical protein